MPSNKSLSFFAATGFVAFLVISGMIMPPQILDFGLEQPSAVGKYLNHIFPEETPSSSSAWTAVEAYPNLTFTDPVQMVEMPYSTKFMVVGKQGKLWTFEKKDTATANKTTVLDIETKVLTEDDAGLLGVAFHPQFGKPGSINRGFIYTFYRAKGPTAEGQLAYLILSRWNYNFNTQWIDPASEYILIRQFDRQEWHNGGGIFFDEEGFLYLSIGDEGGAYDQFDDGQKINSGLFSGVIRIDVDMDSARSHPIRRQPANPGPPPAGWPNSFTQGYFIPNDNPWLSDDGMILEEFFAIGLRSPHRMALDTATGLIWVGDVGQDTREEVSLVPKGGNLQWPYREGSLGQNAIGNLKPRPNPIIGTEVIPVFDYPRSEGNCVIGGFVYRGEKWRNVLEGKYIFGDHAQRTVWTLDYDPAPGISQVNYLTTVPYFGVGAKNGISAFATDSAGEVYVLKLYGTNLDGGKIYKLKPQAISPEPPALLSETGAFADLANLTPSDGLIPYSVNSPLWSDGANKKRWAAIPNDGSHNTAGEQVAFSETGNWLFPEGTVFVKHFEIPVDENNPGLVRRLETRFLIRQRSGGVYGITYKWNKEGTEATLLSGKDTIQYAITHSSGEISHRVWTIPSRANCITCHNDNAQNVLGVRTHQLNGDFTYPSSGIADNQLRTWNHLGIFSIPLAESQIATLPHSVAVTDTTAAPEQKVNSYLDANCAHCHQPNGVGANFDARFSTPMDQKRLIGGSLLGDYHLNGQAVIKPKDLARSVMYLRDNSTGYDAMPPLGRSVVDSQYIDVLKEWILGLDPGCEPAPIPDSQIRLHFADGEADSTHSAENAFDGDLRTSWLTSDNLAYPHELQLDLRETRKITGFRYYPGKDDAQDGTIANYEFYLSENGSDWGSPVAAGDFATTGEEAEVSILPHDARYVRLVALSALNGKTQAAVAELDVIAKTGECIHPGAVSADLQLWLKGNSGFSTANTWDDLSGKGYNLNVIRGNPVFSPGKRNFNGVISFDKSDGEDALGMYGSPEIRSFFIVYNHSSKGEWETPFTNNHQDGIFHGDDTGKPDVYNDTWTPAKSKNGESYVNGKRTDLLNHPRPSSMEIHSRILQAAETGPFNYFAGIDRNFDGRGITGDIAEIIAFSEVLTLAERQRVETCLALQYGISLSHDYYASDWNGNNGTVVWDTGNGYDYRIAGIGKDIRLVLDQRQSKGEGIVEIYHGNTGGLFPATNPENTNEFPDDRSFLVWGDDNGSSNSLNKIIYAGDNHALDRIWKVKNTGNVGVVTLRISRKDIPQNISALYINHKGETRFPKGDHTKVYTLTGDKDFLYTPVIFGDGDIFTFGDGEGELFPAEWIDLQVIQDGENALLKWVTGRETESDYFSVERSVGGTNFTEIAQISAAGNTSVVSTYWHVDEEIYKYHSDILYYRIRQVNLDGTYALSNTATLRTLNAEQPLVFTILPNPATDDAAISVQTLKTQLLQAEVWNQNGQLLYHFRKTDPGGEETIPLPVSKWTPGVYYVRVDNGFETKTGKLLVRSKK
ncbi:MAG: PQQ-dependent sugar dehydrogenase [Bacteroidia bacterium]